MAFHRADFGKLAYSGPCPPRRETASLSLPAECIERAFSSATYLEVITQAAPLTKPENEARGQAKPSRLAIWKAWLQLRPFSLQPSGT